MTDAHNKPVLLFTEKEWDALMPKLTRAMTDYLRPRRAPVFEDLGDYGAGWGSGTYLALGQMIVILTNEHVAEIRKTGAALASQLCGQNTIWRILDTHCEYPYPLDLAVLPVAPSQWSTDHCSVPVETTRIALAHDPVEGEVLAMTGFAGKGVHFVWGELHSEATCYLAREVGLPVDDDRFDDRYHFGLAYRPDLAIDVVGKKGLPVPNGFSGSAVWDTRFVAARIAGLEWSPEMARVTGIVWGWPSEHGCLVATRAEYVRSFLLDAEVALSSDA